MLAGWFAAALATASPAAATNLVAVPMVGCPSDGQLGPEPPARPDGPAPRLPRSVAARLASYQSNEMATLAPRGWHCLGVGGSDGSFLMVTPERHSLDDMHDLHGPAVQVSFSYGGTSGRYEVARMIARLFRQHMDFANEVPAEDLMEPLPTGPYPTDRIRRDGANLVTFTTPPGMQGLGTDSRLAADASPIEGAVMLVGPDDEPSIIRISVRLPPDDAALVAPIVDQVRRANAGGH